MGIHEQFAVVHTSARGFLPDVFSEVEGDAKTVIGWLKRQKDVSNYLVYVSSTERCLTVSEFIREYNALGEIVPKFYTEDPNTEDLLPDGRSLANGMVVLIGLADMRGRIEETGTDWRRHRLLEFNRWCTVTHLRITHNEDMPDMISFVGVYHDGTKRKRELSIEEPWLVKKDSIKDSEQMATARYNAILEAVMEALDAQDAEEIGYDKYAQAEVTTKKILGSLG